MKLSNDTPSIVNTLPYQKSSGSQATNEAEKFELVDACAAKAVSKVCIIVSCYVFNQKVLRMNFIDLCHLLETFNCPSFQRK